MLEYEDGETGDNDDSPKRAIPSITDPPWAKRINYPYALRGLKNRSARNDYDGGIWGSSTETIWISEFTVA